MWVLCQSGQWVKARLAKGKRRRRRNWRGKGTKRKRGGGKINDQLGVAGRGATPNPPSITPDMRVCTTRKLLINLAMHFYIFVFQVLYGVWGFFVCCFFSYRCSIWHHISICTLYFYYVFPVFSPLPSFSSAVCQLRQGHNILYTVLHII